MGADVGPVLPSPRARILFWGDHLHQEVVPAVLEGGVDTVAVLEELEHEAPPDLDAVVAAGGGLVTLAAAGSESGGGRDAGTGGGSAVWGGFFGEHSGDHARAGAREVGWVSWWGPLVARHAVMAVSDVEAALVALVGEA